MKSRTFCPICQTEFPGYKEVGYEIKTQLPWSAFQGKSGPVAIKIAIALIHFAPEGVVAINDADEMFHDDTLDPTRVKRAFFGGPLDACNAARVKCPTCKRYTRWKMRKRVSEGQYPRAGGNRRKKEVSLQP